MTSGPGADRQADGPARIQGPGAAQALIGGAAAGCPAPSAPSAPGHHADAAGPAGTGVATATARLLWIRKEIAPCCPDVVY